MHKTDVIEWYRAQRSAREGRPIGVYQGVKDLAASVGLDPTTIYTWPDQLDWPRQCMVEVATDGAFRADRQQRVHRQSMRHRSKVKDKRKRRIEQDRRVSSALT